MDTSIVANKQLKQSRKNKSSAAQRMIPRNPNHDSSSMMTCSLPMRAQTTMTAINNEHELSRQANISSLLLSLAPPGASHHQYNYQTSYGQVPDETNKTNGIIAIPLCQQQILDIIDSAIAIVSMEDDDDDLDMSF